MDINEELRVIAVSAPHWVKHKGTENQKSLNSTDPFSLQNALRLAAWYAQKGIGHWGHSNWASRSNLKKSVLLMNYFEDEIHGFIDLITQIEPNLIFIGAMTLSYPGAIAIAKCAKDILGDKVFIVLGGKHCNETFWNDKEDFFHNEGSPLMNMSKNKDENQNVFDLVVSGDGEDIIVHIGEIIGGLISKGRNISKFYSHVKQLKQARGNWIAGWVDSKFKIHHIKGQNTPINYNELPVPASVFGITANFPIFEADITGHAYSDMSKGCVYNCYFCSEGYSINGKLELVDSAAKRLYRQFKAIREVGMRENNAKVISAFVEDSIILAGNVKLLNEFNELLSAKPLDIKWGCQFTIDKFLQPEIIDVIKKLKKNGLVYILFGMETVNEKIALRMNKNYHQEQTWVSRNLQAMEQMSILGLKAGYTILWGLGEFQFDRRQHLKRLKEWQNEFGVPNVIGLNWAVKHPLRNRNNQGTDFMRWGTSADSDYLEVFIELFGEASENYGFENIQNAPLSELESLKDLYLSLIYSQIEYKNKINK